MVGQDKKAADSAMAHRLKEAGVFRRTFRHPVTNQVMHGRVVTETNPKSGNTGSTIDCYGAIVFKQS